MEQSLYVFWIVFTFIIFYLASITRDYQKSGVYYLISAIFFLALAILSFGVENIVYDASLSTFVKYNESNNSLQSFLGAGFLLVLSIISFLEMFLAFTSKAFTNTTLKGIKFPWK